MLPELDRRGLRGIGGSFSINPGAESFSRTLNVLTVGQSCTIIVRVQGVALGTHLNHLPSHRHRNPQRRPTSATLTVVAAAPPPFRRCQCGRSPCLPRGWLR